MHKTRGRSTNKKYQGPCKQRGFRCVCGCGAFNLAFRLLDRALISCPAAWQTRSMYSVQKQMVYMKAESIYRTFLVGGSDAARPSSLYAISAAQDGFSRRTGSWGSASETVTPNKSV